MIKTMSLKSLIRTFQTLYLDKVKKNSSVFIYSSIDFMMKYYKHHTHVTLQ